MNGIIEQHVNGLDNSTEMAEPLHIQRLEAALDMRPFMQYAKEVMSRPLSSPEDSEAEEDSHGDNSNEEEDIAATRSGVSKQKQHRKFGTKQERQAVKAQVYNFADLTTDREWLYDILLSDTDTDSEYSDEDEYVREMLKTHLKQQKQRENFYKKQTNTQYAYFATGFLSNHDMFPEHQQSVVGIRKRRRRTRKNKTVMQLPKLPKLPKVPKIRRPRKLKQKTSHHQLEYGGRSEIINNPITDNINAIQYDYDDTDDLMMSDENSVSLEASNLDPCGVFSTSGRGRRRKSQVGSVRNVELTPARRKRMWQLMAKKELGRYHRTKISNHKETVQNCKRVATMCMKVVRQKALVSQKVMKETVWRAKRLTREMLGYWKRYERVERDTRRRMEKEAEEQRKMDVEIIEAKRQTRKLNFLITQTELYAHFMSRKLGQGTEAEKMRILNQLDEETNPRLAAYDNYSADEMKLLAQEQAQKAFSNDRKKTKQFDETAGVKRSLGEIDFKNDFIKEEDKPDSLLPEQSQADLPQPRIFKGTLKAYQIKGMTWLANLYDQGISGILADEMGLGKTVQSIAFLCHIAERYGVWGPFLVISPASTLHNWQQEMQRFVPDFNVVPYWGSPNERKILRQFWEQKDLHTRDATFHVVITSYQLIVSDYKYFNRVKWQYMILDEAQAIKSATSMRWKLLLGFNCRNRLLLSGTPIQNSMAELWALLHFIMPTLFDSHDEFNEWFSKDIESHAENKTGIDEKQISRLHMILKPFMLRRIKKDVENELSDKIEIMVYCPLTIRQKLLYMALKQKIRIEDLLNLTRGGGSSTDGHHIDRNFTSNLMNLVMQFRKVCNHPELFERRDAKSPFSMKCTEYVMPRLVFDDGLLHRRLPSKHHLLYNRFSIFKADYVHHSLFYEPKEKSELKPNEYYTRYIDLNANSSSCFSFTRLCDISAKDMEDATINGLLTLLQQYLIKLTLNASLAYRRQWLSAQYTSTKHQLLEPTMETMVSQRFISNKFIFTGITSNESTIYAFGNYKMYNMQETIEHRVIRSKYKQNIDKAEIKNEMLDEAESAELIMSSSGPTANKQKLTKEHLRLLPEFEHKPRVPQKYKCEPLEMPRFLYGLTQKINAFKRQFYCESRSAAWSQIRHEHCENTEGLQLIETSLKLCTPRYGWSCVIFPDKETLISDAGKLSVLDTLLTRLKAEGHRVLIYSQMTKMIDLLEEYMWHRKHRYMRLDGSSKISARRDMVADFQTRQDIFVFLLSTRAGGLGINLTAADTVIFYDSDWNPTVDQQAMDRAHRLGQTKQVTVYRLICKGTIEERILQRAREKSEIQRMVISGGNFKPDTLKPKEVVSLLLDDEEIEMKYRQKVEGNLQDSATSSSSSSSSAATSSHISKDQQQKPHIGGSSNISQNNAAGSEKKRRQQNKLLSSSTGTMPTGGITIPATPGLSSNQLQSEGMISPQAKRYKIDCSSTLDDDNSETSNVSNVAGTSLCSETFVPGATSVVNNDDSENEALIVDYEDGSRPESPTLFDDFSNFGHIRRRHHPRGTKRGRPRGSTRRGGANSRSVDTTLQTATEDSTLQQQSSQQTESGAGGNNSFITNTGNGIFTPTAVPTPVKRGPGRPRIKTGGPVNQGLRGTPRTRKPIGPLVVPLGSSPAATPLNRSPAMSPAPSPAHSDKISNTSPSVSSGSGPVYYQHSTDMD